jgi:hypothetical protein
MRELDWPSVMPQVAAALGAAQDADVARALGMKGSDYANRKKRQAVPWDRLAALAASGRLSLDSLLGGGPAATLAEDPPPYASGGPGTYRAAVEGVLDACDRVGARLSGAQLRRLIGYAQAQGLDADGLEAVVNLARDLTHEP